MTIKHLYPNSRPTLDLKFAKDKTLDPRITFTRASSGTYVDENGVIQSAASGVARFDHNPLTRESLGLLVEEGRTNSQTNSTRLELFNAFNSKIIPNHSLAPDGTFTASALIEDTTTSQKYAVNPVGFSTVATWCFSFYAKSIGSRSKITIAGTSSAWTGGVVTFDLSAVSFVAGSGWTAAIAPVGNGWFRCSASRASALSGYGINFYLNDANSYLGDGSSGIAIWGIQAEAGSFPTSYIPTPATFTSRASTATYYNASGIIQTAAIDVARDNAYLPDENGVMQPAGLLLEGSGTNFLYPSTPDYTGGFGSWSNGSAPTVPNAGIAPDGTNTAVRVDWSTVSGAERLYYNTGTPTTVGITEVHSFFVKSVGTGVVIYVAFQGSNWAWLNGNTGTRGFYFDFDSETFYANTQTGYGEVITKLPNGWYRISIPAINNGTGFFDTYVSMPRSVQVGDWYIWGVQRENGSLPTSYIPTTSSTVTRAADVSSSSTVTRSADVAQITGSNFSSWFNAEESTFVVDYNEAESGWYKPIMSLQDNGGNGLFIQGYNNNGWNPYLTGLGNGYFSTTGSGPYSGSNKIAFAAQTGSFVFSQNGVMNTSVTSSAITGPFTAVTRLRIALSVATGGTLGSKTISRLTYYPTRLSNAILQNLTT